MRTFGYSVSGAVLGTAFGAGAVITPLYWQSGPVGDGAHIGLICGGGTFAFIGAILGALGGAAIARRVDERHERDEQQQPK